MPDALAVKNLAKRYGNLHALRGVSFSVHEGEIFALLGRNGAGKTTAIECIIGLRTPDAGSVRIGGIDALAEPSRIKLLIGVQLQSTALQDKITPRESLELFASFYHNPLPADSLLERFDLTEKANAHFDTLSGGQRQRLALALAFVHEPHILFLDEPTAGLDAVSRRQLHEQIRRLKEEGRSIILTTHNMEEAATLSDRVAILHDGKIVASDAPDELLQKYSQCRSLEDLFIHLTGSEEK